MGIFFNLKFEIIMVQIIFSMNNSECWKAFIETWTELPFDIAHKIQVITVLDELRNNYLEALPKLWTSDKLTMSLEDIINPIERKERLYYLKESWSVHPGRLILQQKDPQPIDKPGSRVWWRQIGRLRRAILSINIRDLSNFDKIVRN